MSLMPGQLQSLEVDGVPVAGVMGRFANQFDIPDRYAYSMPFDQEVVLVIKARVGPPGTKERKDGVLRVNTLKVQNFALATGDRAQALESEFFENLPPEDLGSPQSPQRQLERVVKRAITTPSGGDAPAEGVPSADGGPAEVRPAVASPPQPQPEPEEVPDESEGDLVLQESAREREPEEHVPYQEPSTKDLPVVGPSGGRVVGDARGQREHDPMLDKFLGLSRDAAL